MSSYESPIVRFTSWDEEEPAAVRCTMCDAKVGKFAKAPYVPYTRLPVTASTTFRYCDTCVETTVNLGFALAAAGLPPLRVEVDPPSPLSPMRGTVSGRFSSPTRPFEEVAECYDGTGACGRRDCAICGGL